MKKNQKNLRKKVLFNASVVLSGLNSPKGGSAKVLNFVRKGKVEGVISEVILDEVIRHSGKFDLSKSEVIKFCEGLFVNVSKAPTEKIVKKYTKIVIDEGDAHVLASCEEVKAKYLVTLDRKHLLILKDKVKNLNILTPGELMFRTRYISDSMIFKNESRNRQSEVHSSKAIKG